MNGNTIKIHEFDHTDKDLDRIIRLIEIIRRYEFLVEFLLEDKPVRTEYVIGGDIGLDDYIDLLSKEIHEETLTITNRDKSKAARMLKINRRRFDIVGGG